MRVSVKQRMSTTREGFWDRRARKAGYEGWQDYWGKLAAQSSMTEVYSLLTGRAIKPTASGGGMGCCPFHDDRTPSMSILPGDKRFYCHSTNCNAQGSAIDFIRKIQNCTLAEATFWLAEVVNLPPVHLPGTGAEMSCPTKKHINTPGTQDYTPKVTRRESTGFGELMNPPPNEIPCDGDTLSAWHPVRKRWHSLQADHWHVYRDMKSQPVMLVGRCNAHAERTKRFYRLTWRSLITSHGDRSGWVLTGWPTGQKTPLFGAENLGIHKVEVRQRVRSTLRILIVEGERTCEVGQEMLTPDWCVLTALGGGKAVQSAQWKDVVESWQSVMPTATEPMRIVIWPDADVITHGHNPAMGFATKITQCLEQAFGHDGDSRIRCRLEIVWPCPTWPQGFDLADLRPDAGPWVHRQLARASRQEWPTPWRDA